MSATVTTHAAANHNRTLRIAFTGLFAALSYVVFTFLQIKVTLPGGDATSFHLGNAVCVIGALLLGGTYGGLGGALGMTIGDLFDPVYVIYAPKTFILKFCIGLITGLVAHKIGKINESHDRAHIFRFVLAASVCGLAFNAVADPVFGYFYKIWIIGKTAAEVALVWNFTTSSVNAVFSAIASVIVYMALRGALVKSGMFSQFR